MNLISESLIEKSTDLKILFAHMGELEDGGEYASMLKLLGINLSHTGYTDVHIILQRTFRKHSKKKSS